MAINNKSHPVVQLQTSSDNLEPRVAKLETGLEMLTRDVASLAQVVRDQGTNIEEQIKQLAIGVTQAAAPKRTDWSLLLTLCMFILALGSAVFWPINQTVQENKIAIQHMETKFDDHNKLQLHPVGQALLGRVEAQMLDHVTSNQRENDAQNKAWERNIDLLTERINARLNKLEANDADRNKADLDELRALRYRGFLYHMGPCPKIPNGDASESK